MKWENLTLQEVCTISKGKKHSEVGQSKTSHRYIQIEDIQDSATLKYTEELGTRCTENDVLIAWDGANAGMVGTGLNGMIGSTLARLKVVSKEVHPYYFYWFLKSKFVEIKSQRTGATIPHVNGGVLRNMKVPIPPLHIQEQIAETLDKADALRRKDQELLSKYDELAQAIFYDMFGDPVSNSKNWDLKLFKEVGTLDRGVSKHRPRNAPELLGGKYPLIQTGDVANCNGYITELRQTYSDIGLKQSKLWPKGTLCITIAANIAKTGILSFDACFPDSIVGFKPNNFVTVNYTRFWIGFLQKILEDSAPESAQKNINLEILRNLKIPVPPIDLQESFEQKLTKILETKDVTIQSSLKGQGFFNSLNNQYFS